MDYLTKPFKTKQLRAVIERAVAAAGTVVSRPSTRCACCARAGELHVDAAAAGPRHRVSALPRGYSGGTDELLKPPAGAPR